MAVIEHAVGIQTRSPMPADIFPSYSSEVKQRWQNNREPAVHSLQKCRDLSLKF